MVHFHSPDCDACKELSPMFEKTAKRARKKLAGPRLAEADVTIATEVAKKYDVANIGPNIVMFSGGKHWKYEGVHDTEDLFKYLECVSLPFLPQADVARTYC